MKYESIREEGRKLWARISEEIKDSAYLSIYLSSTPKKEVMTTFDISTRQYTLLMLKKDGMGGSK